MSEETIVTDDHGDLVIQRTVVDYLDGIQRTMAAGFAETRTNLADKASKNDLERIETRLDRHEKTIDALVVWREDKETEAKFARRQRRWFLTWRGRLLAAFGGAIGISAAAFSSTIADVILHGSGH